MAHIGQTVTVVKASDNSKVSIPATTTGIELISGSTNSFKLLGITGTEIYIVSNKLETESLSSSSSNTYNAEPEITFFSRESWKVAFK